MKSFLLNSVHKSKKFSFTCISKIISRFKYSFLMMALQQNFYGLRLNQYDERLSNIASQLILLF